MPAVLAWCAKNCLAMRARLGSFVSFKFHHASGSMSPGSSGIARYWTTSDEFGTICRVDLLTSRSKWGWRVELISRTGVDSRVECLKSNRQSTSRKVGKFDTAPCTSYILSIDTLSFFPSRDMYGKIRPSDQVRGRSNGRQRNWETLRKVDRKKKAR